MPKEKPNLLSELLFFSALVVLAYSVCFLIVITHKNFWDLVWNSGDNRDYVSIAQGIEAWNPQVIGKVKLFWGTGYGILAVHLLTRADYGASLVLLSTVSGVLGVVFAHRLYGRAVAACFIFINAALMQRTLVGGSEPLFIALFLGSLLAIRKGSMGWGVLLAMLAATVKPIGIFVVAAILLTTLRRKDWRSFIRYAAVVIGVAALYAGPLVLLTGSPFSNFAGYSEDWYHKLPVSIPFYPLITTALASREPLTNKIRIAVWIVAVVFVVVFYGFMRGRLRPYWTRYPQETLATLLMILFLLSYNSTWAWAEFPRFIAPVLPFLLALTGIQRLRQRWLVVAAPLFGLLGAVQIVGLQKLLQSIP